MSENNIGIKYGIFAGVGLVLYFLLFYYIDKNVMMGMSVNYSSILIILAAAFFAVYLHRQSNGGTIEFKEALKTGFIVVVISNLIYWVFFYVLVKTDPELVTIFKQQGIDFYKSMMPEDQWGNVEASFGADFKLRLNDILYYMAKSVIGGFFIALFAALTFKKTIVR